MINITFPDGNIKEFETGIKVSSVVKKISKSLAKVIVAYEVNGVIVDPEFDINEDSSVVFYKFEDKKGKDVYWHSTAHILAQAVTRLFPDVKVAIGPSIDNGFYYDFESEPFTDADLVKIEKEINKILKSGIGFERKELSRNEALSFFSEKNEIYKTELIEALDESEVISCYTQGDFTDLCRGPHVQNTSKIKFVKLLSTSGAYWRGDVKNKMLQRIYGISFPSKEELELYLKRLEEAKKRDHRKLGKELNLFSFHEEAPGSPFYHDYGMLIREKLIEFWRELHKEDNYKEIQTPIMLTKSLWETSGHWQNYKENMFISETEGSELAIKPMNCPGGMLYYKSEMHSYRELPLRIGELGHVHRNEFSGALSGLFRVRSFVQDDAHIFMRTNQIKEEIIGVLNLLKKLYKPFGLDYHLELSTRPEEKSIGTDEAWEAATEGLRDALESYGMGYKLNEGDGAFYGPKIDIIVHDALAREWQCGTIQLDMNLPDRFDLTYIDESSNKARVVMIHRALYGSLERFMGIILEHFGGFLPMWITPVQVMIIPVVDKFNDFSYEVYNKLKKLGIRVEIDSRNEKIGYKIREADGVRKIPYMLVVGEKEINEGLFTVRAHKEGDIGEFKLDDFIDRITKEIDNKELPKNYGI